MPDDDVVLNAVVGFAPVCPGDARSVARPASRLALANRRAASPGSGSWQARQQRRRDHPRRLETRDLAMTARGSAWTVEPFRAHLGSSGGTFLRRTREQSAPSPSRCSGATDLNMWPPRSMSDSSTLRTRFEVIEAPNCSTSVSTGSMCVGTASRSCTAWSSSYGATMRSVDARTCGCPSHWLWREPRPKPARRTPEGPIDGYTSDGSISMVPDLETFTAWPSRRRRTSGRDCASRSVSGTRSAVESVPRRPHRVRTIAAVVEGSPERWLRKGNAMRSQTCSEADRRAGRGRGHSRCEGWDL